MKNIIYFSIRSQQALNNSQNYENMSEQIVVSLIYKIQLFIMICSYILSLKKKLDYRLDINEE